MFAIFSLRRPDILPVGMYHNKRLRSGVVSLVLQAILGYNVASFVGYSHSTSQSIGSRYHLGNFRTPPRTHERPQTNPNPSPPSLGEGPRASLPPPQK